jgi:hypothetical protein
MGNKTREESRAALLSALDEMGQASAALDRAAAALYRSSEPDACERVEGINGELCSELEMLRRAMQDLATPATAAPIEDGPGVTLPGGDRLEVPARAVLTADGPSVALEVELAGIADEELARG